MARNGRKRKPVRKKAKPNIYQDLDVISYQLDYIRSRIDGLSSPPAEDPNALRLERENAKRNDLALRQQIANLQRLLAEKRRPWWRKWLP